MSFPNGLQTVELRFGEWMDAAGRRVDDTVVIAPPQDIAFTPTGDVVLRDPVRVQVRYGSGSVVLPATDAPGLSVQGFTYQVTARGRTVNLSLPAAAPVVDFDLAVPVEPDPGVIVYVGRGEPGPRGEQGPQGVQGPRGADGLATGATLRRDTTVGERVIATIGGVDTMLFGDTGWRDVSATLPGWDFTDGFALMKRENNTVKLNIFGKYNSSGNFTWVNGFHSRIALERMPVFPDTDGQNAPVNCLSDYGSIWMIGLVAGTRYSLSKTHITADAWPTTLPGTPA